VSNYTVRKTTLIISAMLALLSSAAAQQIGYLDLTTATGAPRVREPEGVGGGSCGGSDHTYYPEVLVQLEWLDDTKYTLGETVKFEVKIQNVGRIPITVPWSANLADLEPKDSAISYTYRKATVSLEFGQVPRELSIFASFYGSLDNPTTLRELQPGEWFLVRGTADLLADDVWVRKNLGSSDHVDVKSSAGFMLDTVRFLPRGKNGKPTENSRCINLTTKKAGDLAVSIYRTR
jgi:hypothetical protein